MKEIIWATNNKKPNKVPEPDRFTIEFYKVFQIKSCPFLGNISFFLSIYNGIPDPWKTAKIIRIPKKDKDLPQPDSYRPISLFIYFI